MKNRKSKRLFFKIILFSPLIFILISSLVMAFNDNYVIDDDVFSVILNNLLSYCNGFDSFLNISGFKEWLFDNAFIDLSSNAMSFISLSISLFAWYTLINLISLFFDFINYIIDFAKSFLNKFYDQEVLCVLD